jgi:hypothetical protein
VVSANTQRNLRNRAFALPAVLTTLTILTLIYLTVIIASENFFDETVQQKRELEFYIDALSAEAETAFWASTQPYNRVSLTIGAEPGPGMVDQPLVPKLSGQAIQFLNIDSTPYVWTRDTNSLSPKRLVQLQDDAGLVNTNFANEQTRVRLFQLAGLPVSAAQTLSAELQDYIDNDDLVSLGGAEYDNYQRSNKAVPPNRPMNSPIELNGLLSWRLSKAPNWAKASQLITAQYDSASFNINTASPEALSLMFGLTNAQAVAAVERRKTVPFYAISELGLSDNNEQLYTYPNGQYHFIISDPDHGFRYRSRFILTPQNQDRPVWVDLETLQRFTPRDNPKPNGVSTFPKPGRSAEFER